MKFNNVIPIAFDLCLFINFAQCVPDDDEHIIKKWKLECVEETKVDAELVLHLKTGNWQTNNLPLQKWALCMLCKADLMTRQGVFKIDDALKNIPVAEQADVVEAVEKCLYKTRHLPHEIAWHYLQCYNAAKPTQFRLI